MRDTRPLNVRDPMKPTVFLPEPIAACGIELLERECNCVTPWRDGSGSLAAGAALLTEADAVIVRLFKIGARDIEAAARLKVIAKHGVGVDNIDVEAATRRGIPVTITGAANANAVAEHTLALMLALTRQTEAACRAVREGRFHERDRYGGVELAGKTLGIIGLGRIGSRVANKAALGMGMEVRAYDPLIDHRRYDGPAIFEDALEGLLRKAEFLSLHVPLTSATHRMINAKSITLLKSSCRIINTSRGAVIDEEALTRALHDGSVAGAALDVFEREPLLPDHPLCHAPNTLLTPHLAAATPEATRAMARKAAENVLDALRGKAPPDVVNPSIYGE